MRNIFKKSLLFIATCLLASTLWAQQTTFGFESANELSSNFTYSCEYSNATMTIATDKKHGGSSSLKAYMGGSGGKSNFLVTKNSYNNVTQIKFWIASSDKGKTEFAIESCASENFSSGVNSILALTTFSNLPGISSPSNGTFYEVTITPATAINGYLRFTFRQPSSSGKYLWFDDLEITASTAPIISTDATLSALTYNGISVPNFSANTLSYEVELPAGTTAIPTVAATKNDTKASDPVITQATALPGNATVTVTAEDGTTTKTYTITFTVASSAPKVTSATWDNIKGTATIDQVNKTITGKVTNGSSLTAIAPTFTGDNVASWTPNTAQDFSNGAVNYTFKSSTNETNVYAVTITEAPAVSTDATLSGLTYGGKSVPNFSPNTYTYNIELTSGIKTPPTIAATPTNRSATVQVTQAQSVPGSGKVEVTAEDGETKLTYTINYTVEVPSSDLTTHVPEIYEAKEIAGGYGGTLSVFGGREYEVYYMTRDPESEFCIATTNADKTNGITTLVSGDYTCKANDGWFKFSATGWSSASDAMGAEFGTMSRRLDMDNSCEFTMHISGFDEFALVARDKKQDTSSGQTKPADNRYLEVYIDGVLQPLQFNSNPSIRRYGISSSEHLVRVIHHGSEKSAMYAFSLRLAQEPRTKYLKGNDSTQTVLQTTNIKPITYVTKYNNIDGAQTRLIWDGPEATGIDLTKIDGSLCDTLVLSGQAGCPVGEYKYHVSAYYNGVETNRVSGKFKVVSSIAAKTGVNADAYTGEEMDQIIFTYYAMSPEDVILTWPNGQPDGITGTGANGKYIIGGTPTATGTFPYSITTVGGDTTIQGKIVITAINYGPRSVLYLYKNDLAYEKDAVYQYLNGSGDNKWDLIYRKQKEDGTMRPADQYAHYKWILISEDVDANNPEVIGLIRGEGANLPILNLKGFTYSSDRLGWGEPDNGAIDTTKNTKARGTKLYIQQPSHPVFAKMPYLKRGDSVQVLANYELNGLMPINVFEQGTFCLATAYTRDINNYYGNGEQQTALHEVPADMRGGKKYICLPMARNVTLLNPGKGLLDGIVAYLTSAEESGLEVPNMQINSFSLFDIPATISQSENTITISLPQEKYDDLATAHPVITLADPNTHVTPSVEPSIDLRNAIYFPKTFVVSDYINRRAYSLTIEIYDPQGIEDVYTAGQWVNIYDIYGRKVATTNEDIYTMELPRGMYIIVTESGETIKIMR